MSHVIPPRIPNPVKTTTLTSWAEQHINSIFKARNDSDFDNAFSSTFARGTTFTLNGEQMSESDYKKHVRAAVLEGGRTNVAFSGAVEVPKKDNEQAGAVGLFMHASEATRFVVIGIPETETVTASFNMIIEVPVYHGHGTHEPKEREVDMRRVVSLNEVSAEKRIV